MGNKYRSGLERRLAQQLDECGIPFEYETIKLEFNLKKRGVCSDCGSKSVKLTRTYNPDFIFGDGAVIVEAKGRFTSPDRTKMKAIKEEHPDRDIRMLFQRDNWVTSKKKQKYSDWCKKYGIPYAFKEFPKEWIRELKNL